MKRIVRKEIRPIFSTTVDPSEYDIDAQMERMVKLANRDAACFVEMDVGKVWGLYQEWKRLANVARVSSGAAADRLRSDDAQSAQPALLDGAAPDGNAGPRPRHTGRALRPASIGVRHEPAASEGE